MKLISTHLIYIIFCLLPFISNGQPKDYITRYTPSAYKAGPRINHMIRDHRDFLYFATNKGVLEYDGSEWRTIPASNFSSITYIRQAEDQTIYIGADNDFGLLDTDSVGNLYFKSLLSYANGPLGEFNEIWQIEFLDGKVYFQSDDIGVYEWDGKQITLIPAKNTYIFNIDERLYGSSLNSSNQGIFAFGYFNKGKVQNIKGFEKFYNDAVYQTFPWGEKKHLLITSEHGLFWLDTKKEEINEFKSEATDYIKEHWFFDGMRIDPNTLALGTWKGGLILVNNQGEILEVIDKKSGILANMVYHMVMGANHDLWLGTSDGIAKIDLDSLSIPFEFEKPSPPHSIIRSIVSNGTENLYNRPFHLYNQELTDTIIRLTKAPATLSFQYAVPGLAGNEISFRSKLDGFDDDWNAWTSSHQKEYTGISESGNYTFNVIGKDQFGNETNVASIPIIIDIPWFKTRYKYAVVFPILFIIVFLFFKVKNNQYKKSRARLERIINERTSDLLKKQEHLEQVNAELKTSNHELDHFVYHTSHDLKAPLKSILGLINLSEKENDSNENLRLYLQMIEKSVLKLEEFIFSIVEYSMNANRALKSEKIDMVKMIEEVLEELKEFSHLKEINIIKNVKLEREFISDPVRIKIVINNLVTNAVKYHDLTKEDPYIKINAHHKNGSVHIDVIDNGSGIDDQYQEKVFDMFYRASTNSSGSGLGLYIIKETVNNLKGTISLKSKVGSGTSVQIILPEN